MKKGWNKESIHIRHKKTLLFFLIVLAIIIAILLIILISPKPAANVAVIQVKGPLLTGEEDFPLGYTYSDDLIELIDQISKNPKIQAVVFEINSGGGSAVASQEIADAVLKISEKKLTIGVIREIGASGAYWVASACDYIISSPMAITGSIGVMGSYLEYAGLLERYNITYQRLVSGEYKDLGTPYKELTDEEREILQKVLDSVYDKFVSAIAVNRNLSESQVRRMATGEFYLGEDAKDMGLIDELGNMDSALTYINKTLGIEPKVREYKKKTGFSIFYSGATQVAYWMGKGIGSSLTDLNLENSLSIRT
ncbi:MAG: signal peptide peptidase SppA [archaeon]|nr:MAG: signal peptide peptidase SppA [archaeon]